MTIWLVRLDQGIKTRFAEKRFAPPVEFYSAPESVQAGMAFPPGFFESYFDRKNFRRREFGQPIQPGDVSIWTAEQCLTLVPQPSAPTTHPSFDLAQPEARLSRCIAFRNLIAAKSTEETVVQLLALDGDSRVLAVHAGADLKSAASVDLEPELFAQYYGDKPVLRQIVTLGTVPTHCLNGLLAIEDAKFLEHSGISITGLMRAILTVLTPGQRAQGGSTITQQLVKNYFLNDERTFKRKVTEMAMALFVERRATKDEILETYINLIYMGQNGPFQVRGLAAASEHYFGKPIADLSLDQCALLVGVLNNPGFFNPFTAPERALKRRARVIERMSELNLITPEQGTEARAAPLPTKPKRNLTEPAPYFVQAVRRVLDQNKIDEADGLKVFTTLNLRAQEAAHQAIRTGLDRLETNEAPLKKLKSQGKFLEASLISSDPRTGAVQAMVGGRGYLLTQFNRALDSRRQVGSVMKPFVYLAAFETRTPEGVPYSPLTLVHDKPTTIKFEGQTWTPGNYDGKFYGDVPIFWALKESLNVATANLGMSVGLGSVIDVARRLGVTSKIDPVPSLTLGAFELAPVEVLQAYGAISQFGRRAPLTLINRVEDLSGRELYRYDLVPETVTNVEATAELVGVMKQNLINGTGRAALRMGFTHPAGGKTGTTNDKKDAWFAGFTPYHASVVWVGYDDNTSHGLTGGGGAVPIWATYMKNYASVLPANDFAWPETVEKRTLSPEQQEAFGVPKKSEAPPSEPIEIVVRK